jgi:ribulose-bisphosphate carboxylase large chain
LAAAAGDYGKPRPWLIIQAARYNDSERRATRPNRETGVSKVYLANITDEVDRLTELHDAVVANGANAVMVSALPIFGGSDSAVTLTGVHEQIGNPDVAEGDALRVVALDHHVGVGDGLGLWVQFLAVGEDTGTGVPFQHLLDTGGVEAASAAAGVVDVADHALAGQHVPVGGEDQGGGQPHHVPRREVLTGCLVRRLGEAADQPL